MLLIPVGRVSGPQDKWFKLDTGLGVMTFNHSLWIETFVDPTVHLHVRSECFRSGCFGAWLAQRMEARARDCISPDQV